ncbi:MAG: relaxase/mobilization nuclease domain-containing protein [Paracoccaceae bacterium]
MILVGNQRGGAREVANHLMKPENERVTIHEIRGFVSQDLHGAYQESQAIAQATKCKQHLYSLSLNPPKDADASPELFVNTIERAEEKLGLTGQPRTIVFHEKRGSDGELRMHAHAVWCRIDIENMRAVQMSFDKRKLNDLGRELYREHGWTMPRGFVRHEEANPRNYTLAEWQQAKRAGRHPAKLKEVIQDCWMISDGRAAFTAALKEHGFVLARGDRNGAVAVDHTGEAFSVGRAVKARSKEVKAKLGDLKTLPSREDAHHDAAKLVTDRLKELKDEQVRLAQEKLARWDEEKRRKAEAHRQQIANQKQALEQRQQREETQRQSKLRNGWRGVLDRITGRRKRTLAENDQDRRESALRDDLVREQLLARQTAVDQVLEAKRVETKLNARSIKRELTQDIRRIGPRPRKDPDKDDKAKREEFKTKRRRTPTSERRKRRSNNPAYSRDGPSPEW